MYLLFLQQNIKREKIQIAVIMGLFKSVATAVRFWVHYTFVALAWLVAVPLSACRIHRSLFTGTMNSVLSLPLDLIST